MTLHEPPAPVSSMTYRTLGLGAAGAALALLGACAPQAGSGAAPPPSQSPTLDRSNVPPAGPTPSVDFPEISRTALANGLNLWIVERHDVPLVTLRLVVGAGSEVEPGARAGLASFTAGMLDEGTERRTALGIADEIDFLGAQLGAGASYDAAYVVLSTLRRNLEPALDVFADIVVNPVFPAKELDRVREEGITAITSRADQPTVVASEAFSAKIYGPEHPYGRPLGGTVASLRGFSGDDVREFYRTFYRPNNANLIVVGDVRATEVVPMLERAFAGWERGAVPARTGYAAPGAQPQTRVYLIDKPGAAQSEIRIGHVGVPRSSDDYFPLLVMNSILGGQFSSRINLNLREDKGYTYGARSSFDMRREAGPFVASAGVQTPSTKESVVEFMRELRGIRGERPVTQEELDFAKAGIVRAEPRRLETSGSVADRIDDLIVYGLPPDYFDSYAQRVDAVTLADVERVADRYLDPEHFAIVIVGDRATVEAGLRELPYPVEVVPVEAPAAVGRG